MKPVTRQFEKAFAAVVFPSDAQREEVRTLCRAMFDAGRRSVRGEYRRLSVALKTKAKGMKP